MKRFERPETMPVRDGFLALAFDIHQNERRFWRYQGLEEGKNQKCWAPVDPSLFSLPISLGNVTLARSIVGPESIQQATFLVDDELITAGPDFEAGLYENELAREMLGRFEDAYYTHQHPLCFRAKREQIIAANSRMAQQLAQSSSSLSRAMSSEFKTTN